MNEGIYFVFKPKGADRKQKTDREKMEKRTPHEKEKYQPSYDTTILTEVMRRDIRLCREAEVFLLAGPCRCIATKGLGRPGGGLTRYSEDFVGTCFT